MYTILRSSGIHAFTSLNPSLSGEAFTVFAYRPFETCLAIPAFPRCKRRAFWSLHALLVQML